MYYLNCGFYSGLMYMDPRNMPVSLDKCREITTNNIGALKEEHLYLSTIWGPTCDALDVVIRNTFLPEYHIDNYLIFNDMGAYTNTIETHFNSLKLPKFVYGAFACYDEYKIAFDENEMKSQNELKNED